LINTKLRAPERCGNAGPWTSAENRHRKRWALRAGFPPPPTALGKRFRVSHIADDFFFLH